MFGVKAQELNRYMEDPERYADFMNGTTFQGKQIVKAKYLRQCSRKKWLPTGGKKTVKNTEEKKKVQYLERERDVLMLHDEPGNCFYLACEGQTQADYTMPLRCFIYDTVEYNDQLERKEKETYSKHHPLLPVFHRVFYMGEKKWKSKHILREMMDIPEHMEAYSNQIADYRIFLTDIHEQDPELFRTEWKDIFRLMSYSRKKKELKRYVEEHFEEIKSLSEDTKRFLAVLLDQYEILENGELEVEDMCKAWDGAMELYKEEGKAEGKIEGKIEGKAEAVIDLLSEICLIPGKLREYIMQERSTEKLKFYLKKAARAENLEQFLTDAGILQQEVLL